MDPRRLVRNSGGRDRLEVYDLGGRGGGAFLGFLIIIRGKHIRMAEEQDGRGTSTKTRDTNGPRRSSTKAGGPGQGSTKAGRFDEGGGGSTKTDTKGQDKARKKNAKVRRRLNEGRRFDEGHKGREGVRRRPRVSTKARRVRRPLPKAVCHPPPYAVLIGLPLI